MAECCDVNAGNDEVPGRVEQIICQPCLNNEKRTRAENFCSTCDEFQCLDCSNVHYTHAILRNHKLVNASEATTKQSSFDMKGLDQCDQHHEVLKFFCEDDNQLCCSSCAFVDHRKCQSVVEIQKVAGRSAYRSSTLKVKLEEVREKANIIIDSIVSSKGKLDSKEIPVKIERMQDEVMKMFNELEISVVKDAESFKKETLEKLTIKQSRKEKYLSDIKTCMETIDNVYQNGTLVQQFIVEQKMKNDVNVFQTNVDAECHDLETVNVTFDFDETLKLPPLSVTDYVPGQLTLSYCLSELAQTIVPVNKAMILTPVNSIDLKQEEDDEGEPFYTGIDFLPDGRLVAVDNYNKKCLVYNEKLEKVGSYQLSYKPQSVVAVSEEELAIISANPLKLDILRVTKTSDINLDRTIIVTTQYYSICQKDDTYFVVGTIDHSTPVRIISSTGVEKDFSINFPNKSYPIDTSACTYIRSSDKVVLTDRYDHTVYIYDIKTNTRVVVKDDQIKDPRGVAVGPYDTILVCSKETNSIVQISQTGQILSSHKIDMIFPFRACVSRDKSFLAITNSCDGKVKLQKFKISY